MTNIMDETRIALGGVRDFAFGLASPSIRLGVTGLSRAGKTVFITALVHAITTNARLPLFTAQAKSRIRRAWLEPQPDLGLPRFAYEDHIAALTGPDRRWPESTRRLSQLRITLEVETRGLFGGERDPRKLHIDIMDYPGEWLLDLPLMKQSYAQWSAATLARHPDIPVDQADAPGDETLALVAAQLFTKHGQGTPGRFQMPGDLEGSPLLTFAPLKLGDARIKPGSLAALMARRYDAYVARVVKPFYRDHLSRLDRQIVLVDALSALNTGTAPQLSDALTEVLASFRQGANTLPSRLLGRRIERILFAATKADLLHHTSHDRLERILGRLVDAAATRAQFAGAQIAVTAIAAVRATREARVRDKGEELACITGVPEAGEK
ncbi:MAG: YcjX family protein, partial [Aestuariivirgaceae bacterium]|nr:YcjX family protein [Aestuariivirgaceae bacterium]